MTIFYEKLYAIIILNYESHRQIFIVEMNDFKIQYKDIIK
jgi:hypothetical protein